MSKSVIVVGNGSSLRNSGLGSKIDEFDNVIRINHWRTKTLEKDVGSRTTIWVMYNPKVTMPQFIEDKESLKELKEIWYICWKPENLLLNWKDNLAIKELGVYDRIKRHMSISTSKKIRSITDPPNTGFSLLYVLNQMYDFVYITGFDFGNLLTPNSTFHHYFGNKMTTSNSSREVHDLKFSYDYTMNQIKNNELKVLTNDTEIIKSKFKPIVIKELYCDKCKTTSFLYPWEGKICNHCEGLNDT